MPVNYDCTKCRNLDPCVRHATREEWQRHVDATKARNDAHQRWAEFDSAEVAAYDDMLEASGTQHQRSTTDFTQWRADRIEDGGIIQLPDSALALVNTASWLLDRDDPRSNPEYLRGQVELIADSIVMPGLDHDVKKDAIEAAIIAAVATRK